MLTINNISKTSLILILSSSISTYASATSTYSFGSHDKTSIPGYVVHGINNYNGELVVDYTEVSPSVPYLNTYPPVNEIGVFQEGSDYSDTIYYYTDRDLPVATTRSFFDVFNPGGDINPDTVNIPLGEVGSNFLGPEFTSLDKRLTPVSFNDSSTEPSIYRKEGSVTNPTVGDWEKISGKLTVKADKNGLFDVLVTIRDAFPNAIYTMWDLGTLNPLTSDEIGYAVPLGGLPNVIITNENGCGFAHFKLKYDLFRPCKPGANSCSSYVSAFYNWDNGAYGASAAATWAKAPTGIFGGNQMAWPTSGTVLIEPQNDFLPKKHGCINSGRLHH
jgi:hypothetical protein